ncbi:hypothetical protein ElyMa_006595400 [Elysia marginata]|uniref:Uncharacterized protein n=1 Tax=Elysia marginata TaxID=1093978 RepID=A0AAV4IIE3_9GAST|nr:hypothetical protein ElyMa_006595400 [Elysia marginata]
MRQKVLDAMTLSLKDECDVIIMPEPLATDETDSCSDSPRSRPEKVRLKLPFVSGTKIRRRKKKSPHNASTHRSQRAGDRPSYMSGPGQGVVVNGGKAQGTSQGMTKAKHTYYNSENKLVAAVAPTTFPQLQGADSRHLHGKHGGDGGDQGGGTLPQLKVGMKQYFGLSSI